MYNFFAYLSRMKHIKRWGLMRNTRSENIREHSFDCAMIAHALAVIGNRRFGKSHDPERAALIAMYHEAGEVFTGDIATPVKYYNPRIKQAYSEMERECLIKLEGMLPDDLKDVYHPLLFCENAPEHALVKAADKLCAYIKCIEETKSGNCEFEKAGATIEKALRASELPEVKCFMEEFLPGYSLTLDELN